MPEHGELVSREHSAAVQAAELAARDSYGRLLARLAVRTHDIESAEDALAEAFAAALRQWPTAGVPDNPDGWLVHVAKRRLTDSARHHAMRAAVEPALVVEEELALQARRQTDEDDRLVMLFLCAHPAIDPAVRAPLMLQLVLGLDASRIAAAFLVAPATMSQRLVRAKQRIRETGLRFDDAPVADPDVRLGDVLEAIYAAYGTGWDEADGAESTVGGLRREALWLVRLVCATRPDSAEAHGLLALLLYCESRQPARRTPTGRYIPLERQDPARWDRGQYEEAEQILAHAASRSTSPLPGRFQLEAAIQSVHARRARTGSTDWVTIVQLYLGLMQVAPSIGAAVAHAAALSRAYGPRAGLDALYGIPAQAVASYQPYWAVLAHVQRLLGLPEAAATRRRAIGLTTSEAVRAFLQEGGGPDGR
jgi:RNA polymerase sigma-70 factor (ECF subfamily)